MSGFGRIFLVAAALCAACSCGEDPRLEGGGGGNGSDNGGTAPGQMAERVSIAYVKSLYVNTPVVIDREIYFEGRVVSSDMAGNFRNTMVVDDGAGGIMVMVDVERVFETYKFGDRVTVLCNSLVADSYGGVVRLGCRSPWDTDFTTLPLPHERLLAAVSVHDGAWERPVPVTVTIGEINAGLLNRLVALDGVQFVEGSTGAGWCDGGADTDRHLVDREGRTLVVRTSGRAGFADAVLPRGSGYIEGVLGYFNGVYQLTVNDAERVVMDMGGERF